MTVAGIDETTQYLTFTLDTGFFALDIATVREVLDYTNITKVPQTPDFMRGVINLRGSVVPVVDMRCKFGMDAAGITVNTCIIIVEVEIDGDRMILGAMADSVEEVLDFSAEQIEPPPRIGSRLKTDFIKGMGKRSDRFVIILDIDRVFSALELGQVAESLSSPTTAG